ncbi:MAG: 50S ribosomal protein L25 [Gaiellales bacterium]
MSTDRVTLNVQGRLESQFGSRNIRRLRHQGLVPGVLYGGKGGARAFLVGERELRAALTGPSGMHAIVDVVVDGETTPHHAVVKEFQQHPLRGTVTHIDFHEVRLDRPIETTVTLTLVGDSPGVRMGGIIQAVTREVHIQALPTAVPEHVEASVEALELGGMLRLEDVVPPEGVTILDDPQTVVASCLAPRGIAGGEGEGAEGEGEEAAAASEAPADGGDDASAEG